MAHNAEFVTHHDAARIGTSALSKKVANVDADFVSAAFDFLSPSALRIAKTIGDKVQLKCLKGVQELGSSYARDEATYRRLKKLATYVSSRPQVLPDFDEENYQSDLTRL